VIETQFTRHRTEPSARRVESVVLPDPCTTPPMSQAELQTERKRVVLYDNTANLLPVLTSNGRHDFIVEHDLKEIGPHTYVHAPYPRPPHLRVRCAE